MTWVTDVLGYLALIAAGAGGLLWIGQQVRRVVRAADVMSALVSRELSHNSGKSMKDDVHGTAVSIARLDDRVSDLYRVLESLAEANHLIWPAIEAVARAQPPKDNE